MTTIIYFLAMTDHQLTAELSSCGIEQQEIQDMTTEIKTRNLPNTAQGQQQMKPELAEK
jgi:hypothetical protein